MRKTYAIWLNKHFFHLVRLVAIKIFKATCGKHKFSLVVVIVIFHLSSTAAFLVIQRSCSFCFSRHTHDVDKVIPCLDEEVE